MGKDAPGKVQITYDKPFYHPGSQVSGNIFVQIWAHIIANDLSLKIKGKEKGQVVYLKPPEKEGDQFEYEEKSKKKEFFSYKFPIYSWGHGMPVPPGQYQFPFTFVLPNELPNSFSHHWSEHGKKCYGKIEYEVKAELDAVGPDFKAKGVFNICQAVQGQISGGTATINKEVKMCCCISKGKTIINASFEKNQYKPGEVCQILAEVDNSESSADISDINGVLRQVITVNCGDKYKKVIEQIKEKCRIEGIKAGEKLTGDSVAKMQLTLKPD